MQFKDVALITGAAGDIGRELCSKFSQEGFLITAIDIDSSVKSLARELNINQKRFLGIKVDVTKFDEVQKVINHIIKNVGSIKILVNNAGGPSSNMLFDTTIEQWLTDIDLNLNAVYYVMKLTLPHMVKEGGGNIVNIGSVNGLYIYGHPAYSAAKAGMIQLSKFVAMEFGKHKIRTNIICPGTVKTKAWDKRLEINPELFDDLKELYSIKDIASPEDVANLAVFLSSSKARMMNGSTVLLDGGLTSGITSIASKFSQCDFNM